MPEAHQRGHGEPLPNQQKSIRAVDLFQTLKQRILQWEYPPGHRFTEDELCREFGVSRSPVRETLRMLEENRLVDKLPYRGCTVKQPNLQELGELYDVRIILESAVVEQLATHGMPAGVQAEVTEVWSALAQVTLDSEIDGAVLANQDRAFHETLAEATGNRTLYDMVCSLNERLHFIRMTDIVSVDRLWETCREHLRILEHIAAGEPEAAKAAMRANIDGARAHVKYAIKEALARAYLAQTER